MITIQFTQKEFEILKLLTSGLSPDELVEADIMIASALYDKLCAARPTYNPTKEDIWAAILLAAR